MKKNENSQIRELISFLDRNDLAFGHELTRAFELLSQMNKFNELTDIVMIINLHNACRYVSLDIFPNDYSMERISEIKSFSTDAKCIVARYMNGICIEQLVSIIDTLTWQSHEYFWGLYDHYKLHNKFSQQEILSAISLTPNIVYHMLQNKGIVKAYGELLKNYMLSEPTSAEWLLDQYEIKHDTMRKEVHFPSELNEADKDTIMQNYIRSPDPNLNYVRLIGNIQSSKERVVVSPKTKLEAQKKALEIEKAFFTGKTGIQYGAEVIFSGMQDEVCRVTHENGVIRACYSRQWIVDNQDYPTLLNNFIYLFGFVDMQGRCTFVSKDNWLGLFEKHFGVKSYREYVHGVVFSQLNILTYLQMVSYMNELERIDICLESVIEWFFNEYIAKEFGIEGFMISMPSRSTSYLEKCTMIMPAFESVLKQFTCYCDESYIDYELINVQSEQLLYQNIPSLLKNKYVYGQGDAFNTCQFLLFSDQSVLGYFSELKIECNSLFEALSNHELVYDKIAEYQKQRICWLVDQDILSIVNGNLVVNDWDIVDVLKDLYDNEVLTYCKFDENLQSKIRVLVNMGYLVFGNTLFSKPESNYYNYSLNKAVYSNGYDLRNKYSHTQPRLADEKYHQHNYVYFLRLIILAIIKMNDEMCIV